MLASIVLSTGELIGLGGMLSATGSTVAGWATHRLSRRRFAPELRDLAATTEGRIAAAARDAVEVVEHALKSAREQLETMSTQVAALSTQLAEANDKLDEANRRLARALADRDERDTTIKVLRAQVRRLEDRVRDLEGRLGGPSSGR